MAVSLRKAAGLRCTVITHSTMRVFFLLIVSKMHQNGSKLDLKIVVCVQLHWVVTVVLHGDFLHY